MSSRALDEARAWVANHGGTLGEQLVAVGAIADDTLTDFYRKRLLVPQVNPNTLARLSNRVVSTIPSDMAVELRAVPVSLDADNNLTVAMSDPSDRHAVDEIAFFTGTYVVRAVATQMQIAWCLAHYYGHVTSLGQRLLQPTSDAQPQPQPQAAPQPIPRVKGHTAKVEAARHRAIAPVTGPVNVQRPNSGELDLVAKFGPAATAAAEALRQPDVIPPAVRTAAPEAITPVETPRPPAAGVVARVTPVKIERRSNDIIETVRSRPAIVVPTAAPSSPTLRPPASNPEIAVEPSWSDRDAPPTPRAVEANWPEGDAQTTPRAPAPAEADSDGSVDKPRARSVSGEIRVPVRRAPSIRPPMPETHEDDDDDSPVITVEVNEADPDPTGPRRAAPPVRARRKVKTDPPELAARAGEIGGSSGKDRKVDTDEPRIIISEDVDPSNRPPDVSGELRVVQHRDLGVPATTIEIRVDHEDDSAVIHAQIDKEESEPVLLERRRPSDPVPVAGPALASIHAAETERTSTRKKGDDRAASSPAIEPRRKGEEPGASSSPAIEPPRRTLVGRPKPEADELARAATQLPSPQRRTLDESQLPGGASAQPKAEPPRKTLVGHSDPGVPLPADARRQTLDPNLTPTPLTGITPPTEDKARKTLVGHSAQIPIVDDEPDQVGEASDVVVLEARKPARPTPERLRPQKPTVIGIGATAAATQRSHRDTDASGVPAMVDDQPTQAEVAPPELGFDGQPDVDPTRVDLLAAPALGENSDETLAAPPSPMSDDTDPGTRPAPSPWDAPTRTNPVWDQPTRTAPKPKDHASTTPGTGAARSPASSSSIEPAPASSPSIRPAASSPSIRPTKPTPASSPSIKPTPASSPSIKPTPASAASSPAIRTPAPPATTGAPKRATSAAEGETTNPRSKPAPARTTPDPDNATTLPRMPPRVATPAVRRAVTNDDDDGGPTTSVMSAVELDEAIPDRYDDVVPGHLAKQRIDHDPVDDGWGPPGTTIPPPLLGAIPGSDDDELIDGGPASRIPMPDVDSAPLIVTPPSPPEPARGTPDAGAPGLVNLLEESTMRAIELIRALERAQSRDEVMKLMISHLAQSHARAGFFSIKPDASKVNELAVFAMQPVPAVLPVSSLRLDRPSTLQDVVGTRLPYRGPMHDDASRTFLMAVLGACPPEILLVPVAVRERVVGVLFGEMRMRHTFDDQLALAARAAGMALERILKAKRS